MRIALVSDIHGNLTAFEAVLDDLQRTAPDLILHGGDLTVGSSGSREIVDRIRELGWAGVAGNTDEMLFRPSTLVDFAAQSPHLRDLFEAIGEVGDFTREQLGAERLAWLAALPMEYAGEGFALVHASPATAWRSPMDSAADDLEAVYGPLARAVVVYGHIHRPYVRNLPGLTVANSGSVGMPHDGDRRASYLLLDDGQPSIRRVEYDVDRELKLLRGSGMPHAEWTARTLEAASPQML